MLRVVSEDSGELGELMILTGGYRGSGDARDGSRRAYARSWTETMARSMEVCPRMAMADGSHASVSAISDCVAQIQTE
jgi:hypothetical protein